MNIIGIFSNKNKRVFLDHASATPMRKEVLEVMQNYDIENFANPSALYKEARIAKENLLSARKEVASVLNTTASQVIFTSGGTEANNIAILGVFERAKRDGIKNPHIISAYTEHPAVREVLVEIEKRGGEVTLIKPKEDGLITAEQVSQSIKENTVLVSVMFVNNEIGVLQPIKDISQIIKYRNKDLNKKVLFHTDACQAPLWYGIDVSTLGVDLLSLDGLKIGGPRGVGCLYVKGGTEIMSVMFGGGQEGGLRSGTESVGLCLGFAKSLVLAKKEKNEVSERVKKLRDDLWLKIQKNFDRAKLNGSLKHRSPNNLNVCFEDVDAEYLTVALDTYGVCVSYSSSCRTLKEDSTSYVIESIRPECKGSSIRFTLGVNTSEGDINFTIEALKKGIAQVTGV